MPKPGQRGCRPTSAGTNVQALPFASVAWYKGNSTVHYRMATMVGDSDAAGPSDSPMPRYSVRNGNLVMEHGTHQEIGWERRTSTSQLAVLVYTDQVKNPVLEARAHFAGAGAPPGGMLFDPASSMLRASGPAYSSAGFEASVQRRLPGNHTIRVSYTSGDAVVMPALPRAQFNTLIAAAHARRVQSYALSLSGTLEGTGTRWQASYSWQPDDTVTAVAPFAMDALAPYLNLHICQKIHESRDGAAGVEALVEVRNLLAQGYHPYLLRDGSILLFAQEQRGLTGGLAFTF